MFLTMFLLCVNYLSTAFQPFSCMCDSPYYVLPTKWATEKIPVPCGRCPPCKIRRVNSWVFRLSQEAKVSSSAHFVTLTYDTREVPISSNGFMTLSSSSFVDGKYKSSDYQLFMKRLRKLCPGFKLKYYAVGEYGETNMRPHYHAIIFNCPDSSFFNDAWGKGQIHVGTVTPDSCAYCMKYIDKAAVVPMHSRDDRVPEFPLMSKGLGDAYLTDDVIKYHRGDLSRLYVTREGGFRSALPRYYRQKIYSDNDLKSQVLLIQDAMSDLDAAARLEFDRLNYPSNYTFDDWKVSKAYGRYRKFYNNQISRNV